MTSVKHRWPIRVYYEDTDFSGVVYHANYLRFLERGRTEMLRAAGVSQTALHAEHGTFVVRRMAIDFAAAARMDDDLAVVSRIAAIGGASLAIAQTIGRDAMILVTATVRIGLVADGRAVRLPADLRRRLSAGECGPI